MRALTSWILTGLLFLSTILFARKIVLVDTHGDEAALRLAEIWERRNGSVPPDVYIYAGGNGDTTSFKRALDSLQNGDTLVIITHGNPGTFEWGDSTYNGFGNGPGEMPVPPGVSNLDTIYVKMHSCHGDSIPSGDTTSILDELEDIFGGTSGSEGFRGQSVSEDTLCFIVYPADTARQDSLIDSAYAALAADPSWATAPAGQQVYRANQIIAAAGIDTVNDFRYTMLKVGPPREATPADLQNCSNDEVISYGGCNPSGDCGFAFVVQDPVQAPMPIPISSRLVLISIFGVILFSSCYVIRRL